jgi:hypothetical protein
LAFFLECQFYFGDAAEFIVALLVSKFYHQHPIYEKEYFVLVNDLSDDANGSAMEQRIVFEME